jgi:ABC-type multidrug transport system fused ATPase/permease subunit
VLILDDCTSAVDVETEGRIQEAIAAEMKNTTCIMVAQRISSVLTADKILIINGGRIAGEGNHWSLLASNGLYREIYDSQLGRGANNHV